VDFLTPVGVV